MITSPETPPDISFHMMLSLAANALIGFEYIEEGDREIDVGESIDDDGVEPDAVDQDGGEWRIKVASLIDGLKVTRHKIRR